jgi:hypothetical protein
MGIPGYQWVHLQVRKRVVDKLDELRGHTPREEYVAGLVEADVAARKAGAARQVEADARPTSQKLKGAQQ